MAEYTLLAVWVALGPDDDDDKDRENTSLSEDYEDMGESEAADYVSDD
jgi:hypothetical protein